MALKLRFVKQRGDDTYESKEKNEHKDESVVFTETGNDKKEQEEVARVTYVNNIMHSIISRFTIPMDSIHTSLTFQTTLRQAPLNTREFCIVKAMTLNKILRILVNPYLIPFSLGE